MADTTENVSGLQVLDESKPKEETASVQIKNPKTAFGTLAGNVGVTPGPELLARMQEYIDSRTGALNTFVSGLKDASAVLHGQIPERERQKAEEAQSIFKMRADLATMQQAQEQTKRASSLVDRIMSTGMSLPGAGGVGGQRSQEPIALDSNVLERMALFRQNDDPIGAMNVYNEFLKGDIAEATKRKYNVEADVPRLHFTPDGEEEMISINDYKAKYGKAPSAPAKTSPSLDLPDLRDAVQKGLFAQESTSGKADTSKPNSQGVQGPMQIKDTTFKMYQDQGIIPKNFSIDNPRQNRIAGNLIADHLFDKHKGNVDKVFAEYYGGPGAINKDGTINLNQKNQEHPDHPTVGQYIEEVKKKAGITPEMLTQVQPQVGGKNKPLSYGEYKQQQKRQEALQQENLEVNKKPHEAYLTATNASTLSDRQVLNTRWENWINKNSARSDKILGLMNEPTLVNAVANVLSSGINTTQGNISMPGLEEAFQKMQKGVKKEDVEALQEIKQILESRILDVIQRTKGSSSDKDMDAFRTIAGSSKNGLDLIYKLQQYDKQAIIADKEDRAIYDKVRKQNKGVIDYSEYNSHPERQSVLDKKVAAANEISKSQFTPKKAPVRPTNVPEGAKYSPSTNTWWLNGKQVG